MSEEQFKAERKFMKPQKLKISDGCQKSARFMKPGRTNQEDRMNFIEFWAEYIRTHSDEEWSKQQNVVINSQIQGAHSLIKKKKE